MGNADEREEKRERADEAPGWRNESRAQGIARLEDGFRDLKRQERGW